MQNVQFHGFYLLYNVKWRLLKSIISNLPFCTLNFGSLYLCRQFSWDQQAAATITWTEWPLAFPCKDAIALPLLAWHSQSIITGIIMVFKKRVSTVAPWWPSDMTKALQQRWWYSSTTYCCWCSMNKPPYYDFKLPCVARSSSQKKELHAIFEDFIFLSNAPPPPVFHLFC